VAAADRLYALYLLAVTGGLRRGELLGLRWRDVDLGRGVIGIRQTLTRTGAGLQFQEPKTDRSRRTVALSPLVVAALRRRREEQRADWDGLGRPGEPDLVFDTPLGTPIEPRNLARQLDRLIGRAAVPRIRFHDLRHTSETLMLLQGEHPKIVSERLGHTTVSQTLDTYSHVLPGLQAEAARKLEEQLFATTSAPPARRRGRATRRPAAS
jgi:integrase